MVIFHWSVPVDPANWTFFSAAERPEVFDPSVAASGGGAGCTFVGFGSIKLNLLRQLK